MGITEPAYKKTCENCGNVLHGRTDQRFCNDTCRNSFNRKTRLEQKIPMHPNAAKIFGIIKKNYEILKREIPRTIDENEMILMDMAELLSRGFDFRFFTGTHTEPNGLFWHCIFERAYTYLNDNIAIKDFPGQANIA